MANGSYTYSAIGTREDLIDVVTNISPDKTPCLSKFGKGNAATSTKHEWLTDSLRAATSNAVQEGAEFSPGAIVARTRLFNYVQIMDTGYYVSDTQRAVKKAGVKDEMAYQMLKAAKELALDMEYAIMNQDTPTAAASGTAPLFGGLQAFNTVNAKAMSTAPLDEESFNDAIQLAWDDGGNPDWALMHAKWKRQIAKFTGGAMKTRSADAKKITMVIDVYESDFGTISCVPSRLASKARIDILETQFWKMSYLVPIHSEDVAKIGHLDKKMLTGQLTMECRSKEANSSITGLPTT